MQQNREGNREETSGQHQGSSMQRYGSGYGGGRRDLSRRGDYGMSYGGSPFGMIRRMMDEMDRAFDDFFLSHRGYGGGQGQGLSLGNAWPQVEMREKNGRLVVCADLPGMRKEDVHVELNNDQLILQGERRQESEQQGYSERSYGSFYRVIPLPEGIDASQAQAHFQNGVLEVSLPAPRQSQGKKIDIQEGGVTGMGSGAGSQTTGVGASQTAGTGSSQGTGAGATQTPGAGSRSEREVPVGAGKP